MAQKLASKLESTQAYAVAKFVPLSPQKARLVVDLVRGKKAVEALDILRFTPKAAAEPISKVIASAVANAAEGKSMNPQDLVISQIWVDGGPIRSWRRFAARGRFRPIERKTCHINVIVGEKAGE
jgi:large subunit ribosomal protein L22